MYTVQKDEYQTAYVKINTVIPCNPALCLGELTPACPIVQMCRGLYQYQSGKMENSEDLNLEVCKVKLSLVRWKK